MSGSLARKSSGRFFFEFHRSSVGRYKHVEEETDLGKMVSLELSELSRKGKQTEDDLF